MAGLDDIVVTSVSETHSEFAQAIADALGKEIDVEDVMELEKFSGGEYRPKFRIDVVDKTVVLVTTEGPFQNPMDMVFRTGLCALAARQNGAREVISVMTDFPFGRQDKDPPHCTKKEPDDRFKGEPNTVRFVARTLKAGGVDKVLSMHIHSENIFDYFGEEYGADGRSIIYSISPHHMVANYIRTQSSILDKIKDGGRNIGVVSPDEGARQATECFIRTLDLPKITHLKLDKHRKIANDETEMFITFSNANEVLLSGFCFEDAIIIYYDDMIDTGGTPTKGVKAITNVANQFVADKSRMPKYIMYATMPVFGGGTYKAVQKRMLKSIPSIEFVLTNARPFIEEGQTYKFKEKTTVLGVAKLYADAIINCCLAGTRPEDCYRFGSFDDMSKRITPLYDVLRHEKRHFMTRHHNQLG
jgi:phosphoribosylpyrophosphate synthetase